MFCFSKLLTQLRNLTQHHIWFRKVRFFTLYLVWIRDGNSDRIMCCMTNRHLQRMPRIIRGRSLGTSVASTAGLLHEAFCLQQLRVLVTSCIHWCLKFILMCRGRVLGGTQEGTVFFFTFLRWVGFVKYYWCKNGNTNKSGSFFLSSM